MDAMKKLTEGMIKENRPQFEVGDTVRVSVRIKEGDKERIQPLKALSSRRSTAHRRDLHRSPHFLRRRRRARVPCEQPLC